MRRQVSEEVAEAARRRLELLGRELDQAGLRRVEEDSEPWPAADEGPAAGDRPPPRPVPAPGRHARQPRAVPTPRERIGGALPETLRGGVRLGHGALVLVAALVTLAVGVSAYVLLRSRGGSEPVGVASPSSRVAPLTQVTGSPAAGPSTGRASPADTVTVDVAGRVRRPGVTTLPAGSRVLDAIRRSGGARTGVDLTGLNLARVLVDGEQILVGQATVRPVPGAAAASAAGASASPGGALVNLNTATAEQLDSLPGVGPVTAQKILQWRQANGAFSSIDELLEIDGIGEKTLADIAPRATL